MTRHTDPAKRHDFILLFDVRDGNPNGDPDAGNRPRTDAETGQGIVSDVAIKRKIRDYVTTYASYEPDGDRRTQLNIYIEHRGVLNAQHRKAYQALNIPVASSITTEVSDPAFRMALEDAALPEGFELTNENDDMSLAYTGELDQDNLKAALSEFEELGGVQLRQFITNFTRRARNVKATREEIARAQNWMTQNFYDIRMFGAVMGTSINAGQVRGPVQFMNARSIDEVMPRDMAITRVAITREEDASVKERELGRKAVIPYGLYLGYGFYSAALGRSTGVTEDDLSLLWQAIQNMWDTDRSASRGFMALRGLYIFSHEHPLGNAPAHRLFSRLTVERKADVEVARAFTDYDIKLDDRNLPSGVTVVNLLAE